MGELNLQFAALIGSRICHDLISPIGAINNGMELLAMTGGTPGPEMALISESVEAANARIRFFRIAFGAGSTEQVLAHSEIVSILRDISRGARNKIFWNPVEDVVRSDVQLAFLAIQCVEQALPYGGDISITRNKDQWTFEAAAGRIAFDETLWSKLTDAPTTPCDVIPAQVQFLLLPHRARDLDKRLSVTHAGDRITLTLTSNA